MRIPRHIRNERDVVQPGAAVDLAIELAACVAEHPNARVANVFIIADAREIYVVTAVKG